MRTIFTPRERKVILFLSILFLAGNVIRLYRRHLSAGNGEVLDLGSLEPADSAEVVRLLEKSIELQREQEASASVRFPLDINEAGPVELSALPGIGPARAARIVEEREKRGGYRSLNELLEVPGIGQKTLDSLRGFLLPLVSETAVDRSEGEGPVDLNQATSEELEGLPGIGEILADRILAYRETRGPFRSLEDLKNVEGIGEERLRDLSPFLTVTDPVAEP